MENYENDWSTIFPNYFSRLQSFAVQQLLEAESLQIWWLLVNIDNKLSKTHLNHCYYHEPVWKHWKRRKKIPQLLANLWISLATSPLTTSRTALWPQGSLAWSGLCLSSSFLLPSRGLISLFSVIDVSLALFSPETFLGTVWERQDWLTHAQPAKDPSKMYEDPISCAGKRSLSRCSHWFKPGWDGFVARMSNARLVEIVLMRRWF